MKKKIMAILLAGGLTLGLCGCGGGGSASAMPVPVETETVLDQEPTSEDNVPTEDTLVEYTPAKQEPEIIKPEVAEPDVADLDVGVENESPSIDTSALLTEYVVEYEDPDGYQIRETINLSPIFTEDDAEIMYALWEALGNDAADFPSEESLYDASWALRGMRDRCGCDKLEYVVGTYMIENLTEGFPITLDKPHNFDRHLIVERIPTLDDEQDDDAATIFKDSLASMVMYQGYATYYGEPGAVTVGKPKMVSDIWGPNTFVIALPNGATPNRPSGYRYDKVKIKLNLHYANEFSLKYFREGGD